MSLTVRRADASDADFLAEMLVAAAFWRPDESGGSVAEVLCEPQLAHYVVGWPRPGDLGVVALNEQGPLGAAWVPRKAEVGILAWENTGVKAGSATEVEPQAHR